MTLTPDYTSGSGVARTLAIRRAAVMRNLVIRLALTVPAEVGEPITGSVVLGFELARATAWPPIDFAPFGDDRATARSIRSLHIDGEAAAFEVRDGHIVIAAGEATPGRHEIGIDFVAGDAGLRRRSNLVYSLFVPAHAREVLPCFDQPDLKARWTLELEIPAGWRALANGVPVSPDGALQTKATRSGSTRGEWTHDGSTHDGSTHDGSTRWLFAETDPLPSYLFAFLAGELDALEHRDGQRMLTMLFPSSAAAAVTRHSDEIFRLHTLALDELERYTGIACPFGPFGFALIPDFDFGGMEHPGAVFYRQQTMLPGPDATEAALVRRANLIAHETAHMWFGNLVTMRWFDDVWLKEVFANFMADRVVALACPNVDHELGFVLRHYPPALAIDRTRGARPIRRALDNLAEAGELYDAVIYHKAPIAMAALETRIGERSLRDALRAWLKAHRFGSSDWPELLACIAAAGGCNLESFDRQWIGTTGLPRLRGFPDDACDTRSAAWYGIHSLGEPDRERALDRLRNAERALERALCWIVLHEDMLDGGIAPSRLLSAAVERLMLEHDVLLVERLLDDLAEIYWRFMPDSERSFAAGPIERVLNLRREAARDEGARLFWTGRLADFALSAEALAGLEAIRSAGTGAGSGAGRVSPSGTGARSGAAFSGLPEPLTLRLTLMLALRRPGHAAAIVTEALAHCASAESRQKLAFLAPAVAEDKATRDAFFERLLEGDERGLWQVAGLRLLNDASRAASALDYLAPGLERGAVIRARGEIFLPRQWLTALFSGHGTAEAARIVDGFLAREGLAPRYRELVLQTADPVFRAARIRG